MHTLLLLLLSFLSFISATPTPTHYLARGEHDLPPVSLVMMALAMHSNLGSSPQATLLPHAIATHSSMPTVTTLPHLGPGIVMLPQPSLGSSGTQTPPQEPSGEVSTASNHPHSTLHHFAVVGGAILGLILLTASFFFLLDPRIWSSCACCAARTERKRLARSRKARQKPLPSWMRVKPRYSSDNHHSTESQEKTPPLPSSVLNDSPHSKFSMTSFEYVCDSDTSVTFNRNPFDTPPSNNSAGPSIQIGPSPTRPPRPPTADSPAGIESVYYTDVNDQNFYRHPNPIVLEPTSPIINNPPPMTSSGSVAFNFLPLDYQFFASNALDSDALHRHKRTQSVPAYDSSSITSKRSSSKTKSTNTVKTEETLEAVTIESDLSTLAKTHRKSKSVASWVRYSEFQQKHHIQLQRKNGHVRSKPLVDEKEIGFAY